MKSQTQPVIPHLVVTDGAKAVAFYQAAFGAKEVSRNNTPDGKKIVHCELEVNGGTIMLCDDFPEMAGGKSRTAVALGGSPVTINLTMDDVEATWSQAVKAGAKVLMPLAEQFWGAKYGQLQDPFGLIWSLSTPQRAVGEADLKAGTEKHFPSKRA
jgi:PhnB protein